MYRSTKHQTKYWQARKIDWKQSYFDTKDHPHRALIAWLIKPIPFYSLWEVGVGGGANLVKIIEEFAKDKRTIQCGGSDVSEDAIEFCRNTFKGGTFHVEPGNNLMMSDKSVDVLLSDMTLIYVDPKDIDSYLSEFKRVARGYVILVEFHSRSFWKRLLARLRGYHVYDYRKRLENLGYYDIIIQQIPENFWPGTDKNTEFRHIISARVP